MKKIIFLLASFFLMVPLAVNAESVASIGSSNYETLQAALDASGSTKTIKILSNITLSDKVTIAEGQNVTIDLNGKTISYDGGVSTEISAYANRATKELIVNNGTLTIKDDSNQGVIKLDTTGYGAYLYLRTITNNGVLNITGGKVLLNVSSNGKYSTSLYGIYSTSTGTVNISGGTVQANKVLGTNGVLYAVYLDGVNPATISGGNIICENNTSTTTSASTYGVYADDDALITMTGGNIKVYSPLYIVYGIYGRVNISGGTINVNSGKTGDSGTAYVVSGKDKKVSQITGGKFSSDIQTTTKTQLYSVIVKGGEFNFDPTSLTYVNTKEVKTNGVNTYDYKTTGTYTYVVSSVNNPTKTLKNTNQNKTYADMQEAVNEANVGDTIELLSNYNHGVFAVVVNKGITIDLKGHTLTGTNLTTSEGIFNVSGSTQSKPFKITDSTATSYSNAGKIMGGLPVVLNNGYVELSKIVLELGSTQNAYAVYSVAPDANPGNVSIKGVKATLTGNALVYTTLNTKVVLENLNETFKNDITVNAASASAAIIHGVARFADYTIKSGDYAVNASTSAYIFNANSAVKYTGLISGGNFKLTAPTKLVSRNLQKIVVEGGRYNFNPDSTQFTYGDGYYAKADTSVSGYTHSIDRQYAVKIGTTNYYSLQDAIDDQNANSSIGSIELLRNIKSTETLSFAKNTTFTYGTYSITLAGNPLITLAKNVTVPTGIDVTSAGAQVISSDRISYYSTLSNAISASKSGDTVKLLKDYSGTKMSFTKSITIDLNGNDITSTDNEAFSFAGPVLAKASTININFVNSNKIDFSSIYGGITINAKAYNFNVTIGENVYVYDNSPIAMFGNGNANSIVLNVYGEIESGARKSGTVYAAIMGNGSEGYGGTVINVYNNSYIDSPNAGIYQPQEGYINMYGGTVSGDTGIYMKNGTLTFKKDSNQSQIVGSGPSVAFSANSNGFNLTGDALVLDYSYNLTGKPTVVWEKESYSALSSRNGQSLAVFGNNNYEFNVYGYPIFVSNGTINENGKLINNGLATIVGNLENQGYIGGNGVLALMDNTTLKVTQDSNNKLLLSEGQSALINLEKNISYQSDQDSILNVAPSANEFTYLPSLVYPSSHSDFDEDDSLLISNLQTNLSVVEEQNLVEALESLGLEPGTEGKFVSLFVNIVGLNMSSENKSIIFSLTPSFVYPNGETEVIDELMGEDSENTVKIKFRLPIPSDCTAKKIQVTHREPMIEEVGSGSSVASGTPKVYSVKTYPVLTDGNGNKYVEIEATHFSEFIVGYSNVNPNTLDNIYLFVLALVISGLGISSLIYFKKRHA